MCWRSKTKTSYGLKIYNNNVPGLPTKEAHEHGIALFIEECSKKFDSAKVRSAVASISLEWWDRIAPRPSTGELNTVVVDNGSVYSGLTVGTTCKVAWRGKLSRSAFAHEMLHVVGNAVTGLGDPDHKDPVLWTELEPAITGRLTLNLL
jgi:hypothetical protein